MSVATSAFSLLLALQQAAPANFKSCPLADNRRKAEQFVVRAAEAASPEHRSKYLLAAHRIFIKLYDKTGDDRDLCAARRHLDQIREAQPASVAAARAELEARERRNKPRCGTARSRRPSAGGPRVAQTITPAAAVEETPPAELMRPQHESKTAPPGDLLPVQPTHREQPRENRAVRLDARAVAAVEARSPFTATSPPVGDQATAGRPLVIAGCMTLGLGLALAGVAGYAGAGMVDARDKGYALQKLPADPTVFDRDAALRAEYAAKGNMSLGTGIASGAAVVVGAVLIAIGARRWARATSTTALLPAPGGLVLRARF